MLIVAMANTPVRIYWRTNICVLCGFSFIQTEINEKGDKIERKFFTQKCRLTDDRVVKIKQVVPSFETTTERDCNNGVCIKCFKRVELYIKYQTELRNIRHELSENRSRVERFQLTMPSPRKLKVEKRQIRSPLVSQPPAKQRLGAGSFPEVSDLVIVKKVTMPPSPTSAPLLLPRPIPRTTTAVQSESSMPETRLGPTCTSTVAGSEIFPAPEMLMSETQVPKKSARRSLGFSEGDKENKEYPFGRPFILHACCKRINTVYTMTNCMVAVYYPSGKKTTFVKNETHKMVCRAICRGSNVDKVIIDHLCQSNPAQVANGTAKLVKAECERLCKRGADSILQKKDYNSFFKFNWEILYQEFQTKCPTLLTVISSIVGDIPASISTKPFRHIMVTAAIGLHGRSQEMSVVQYLTSFVLTHGGCTQRDIERLSQIGLCVHPQTVHRKLAAWQENLDSELLLIRDSWAHGGLKKYQLVGDNWDKNILPSYRTSDRKTLSLHLFNIYACVDRVIPEPVTCADEDVSINDLGVSTFIPSVEEQEQLKKELIFIFATSLVSNLPKIHQHFKDIYPKHLEHVYSNYCGMKTTQYPLGLYDCNENKTKELIQNLSEKYVPCRDGKVVESVFFGGDRLTDERVQSAQSAMANSATAKERLEGFVSKIEDFHRLMNFLEAIHKMTYSVQSGKDRGTAYYYRNILNFRTVKGNVKNAYRPYKLLYYTILDALCVLLFINHFDIPNADTLEIPFPDNFTDWSKDERILWLNTTVSSVIEKWFFDDSVDICSSLRGVLDDMNHPENYWIANHADGRFHCHHCDKSYAFLGSLKSHENKVHDIKIEKRKKATKDENQDQLQDHVIMLFKLVLLHKNLDSAVDMADGYRSVRSAKYELPIYNRTGKVKYSIGSIHLTALTSGILPEEQTVRLIANRAVNLQGGTNNNIALDEYLEMLNRDSKVACSGYQTKESIIKHSKEYPHLINMTKHFENISTIQARKGFHHLPSYKEDVLKVVKDLLEVDVLTHTPGRSLRSKDLTSDRNPFDKCFLGLSAMIFRHKPPRPFHRLRDRHV